MIVALTIAAGTALVAQAPGTTEWPAYGGEPAAIASPLEQITRANVAGLRLAWVYRTGDYYRAAGASRRTPLVVDGTLYVSTPARADVVALDPASGVERWTYDPRIRPGGDYGDFANRGVSTWLDTTRAAGAPCRRRVFVATVDARLIALDGATGAPCADFGAAGTVDLARDLLQHAGVSLRVRRHVAARRRRRPGRDRRLGVSDNQRWTRPKASSARTTRAAASLRWSWDPIPRTRGDPGYDTWRGHSPTRPARPTRGPSCPPTRRAIWCSFRPAAPAPTSSAARGSGQNLLRQLGRGARGPRPAQVVWHFQVVHHDLVGLRRAGAAGGCSRCSAAARSARARRGDQDGPPVHSRSARRACRSCRSTERPVPQSDVPGEQAWPTQPFPPPAYRFVPESLPVDDAFGLTPEARERCRAWMAGLRSDGMFTPPSLRGTINYPGHIGGFNWSGVSVDERDGLLVAPVNRLAMVVTLIPRDSLHAARMAHPGEEISRHARHAVRHDAADAADRRIACRAVRRPGASWWRSIWRAARSNGGCRWATGPAPRSSRALPFGSISTRRRPRDRGRARVHRRHARQAIARVRPGDRAANCGARRCRRAATPCR